MLRVLVTSFNGARWLPRCLNSIRMQSVEDWSCYVTDDLSTDDSVAVAQKVTGGDGRFEVIANTQKLYQPGNYHQVIMRPEIDADDVIVTVDGDDWLPDRLVFQRVLDSYSDGDTWITYGSHVNYAESGDIELGYARLHPDMRRARYLMWVTGHLRTFKAFLWRAINEQDLIAPSGNFWEVTGDQAFMYPMLEMACNKRAKFTPFINYVYNCANPLNDSKVNHGKQQLYARLIRTKPPYDLLERAPVIKREAKPNGTIIPALPSGKTAVGLPAPHASSSSDGSTITAYRRQLFEQYCRQPHNRGALAGANLIGPAKSGEREPLKLHLKVHRDTWGTLHVEGASFEADGDGELAGYACVLTHLIDRCTLADVRRLEEKDLLRACGSTAESDESARRVIEALRQTLSLL